MQRPGKIIEMQQPVYDKDQYAAQRSTTVVLPNAFFLSFHPFQYFLFLTCFTLFPMLLLIINISSVRD